jgi:hypothetical protein
MTEGISEGDKFLCVEPCNWDDSQLSIFLRGKIYCSWKDGTIQDELGLRFHTFTEKFWTKYLIKIGNGANYDNPIAQKLNIFRLLRKHGYAYSHKIKEIVKVKTI